MYEKIWFPYPWTKPTTLSYVIYVNKKYYGFDNLDEARKYIVNDLRTHKSVEVIRYSTGKVVGFVKRSANIPGAYWVILNGRTHQILPAYGKLGKEVGHWGETYGRTDIKLE